MLTVTLAALEEHFGYAGAFMLALSDRPSPGRRAYAGTVRGFPEYTLEEYFERWADRDALGSDAARGSFARTGKATIASVYRELDPPRQLFVEEFLRRVRQTGQLSHRLACGWSDGYLTLMRSEEFTEADERIMGRLVPPLAALLRSRLPRGLDGRISAREAQVAELVALGFTNREIAAVLHVQVDTVKKHVKHTLAKLGLARRTDLAVAWATGRRMDVHGSFSSPTTAA